jgi:transposase
MAAHQEPDRLYSEIGKLKVEVDWLKKKSGLSLWS